jgi:hypothetical protein
VPLVSWPFAVENNNKETLTFFKPPFGAAFSFPLSCASAGYLKRLHTVDKTQHPLFHILLETGQLNDELTPEPSIQIAGLPAGMETPFSPVTVLCDFCWMRKSRYP